MYTSFTIENFRCFENLTVGPLARVNLIAGQNNVGKTALLEALWLLSHPTAPRNALRITPWRDLADDGRGEFFADLFPGYDTGLTIVLQTEGARGKGFRELSISRRYRAQQALFDWSSVADTESGDIANFDFDNELAFEYVDDVGNDFQTTAWLDGESMSDRFRPTLRDSGRPTATPAHPCVFEHSKNRHSPRALASRFGRAELEGYLPSIEATIRLLEPRLKRMTTIADNRGNPSIHGDIGAGRLLPMSIMGDGIKRLLALALDFSSARNGTMLIDEIENGLHHSALVEVWKYLDQMSRMFNVQVFATTHSYECIVAANNAFNDMESSDLHLHRMHRQDNKVKAVTYDKNALDTNIEYLWELR